MTLRLRDRFGTGSRTFRGALLATLSPMVAFGLVGCGGASESGITAPPSSSDAGVETNDGSATVGADAAAPSNEAADAAPEAAAVDNGAASTTYPAFTPAMGQIENNGGLVLSSPTVVAITWASDPSASVFDDFADTIGTTSYWQAANSEYGVGAAVSGATNHVSITTAAPAQLTDDQLQALVTANAGVTPGWPAATEETIFAFFLPPETSLQISSGGPGGAGGGSGGNSDACQQGIGGYHDQVDVGSITTSYAVVPSCDFGQGNTPAQQSTMSMSHELDEASTDPHPNSDPGMVGFTNDTFAFDWFQEFSDETSDSCEFFDDSFFEDQETSPSSFDYWVQRSWSNKAANAGHSPCQPAASAAYFNVTPLKLGAITLSLPAELTGASGTTAQTTRGIHIPLASTVTFQLGFYSDGPTSGPWELSYSEGSPLNPPTTSHLKVGIDKKSGVNGEIANVTVTVKSVGSLKGELLDFQSTLNGLTHHMPVVIGN